VRGGRQYGRQEHGKAGLREQFDDLRRHVTSSGRKSTGADVMAAFMDWFTRGFPSRRVGL